MQIADYFILKKADSEKNAFQWRNPVSYTHLDVYKRQTEYEEQYLEKLQKNAVKIAS